MKTTTTTRVQDAGGRGTSRRSLDQVREDLARESARADDALRRIKVLRRELAELLAAAIDRYTTAADDELAEQVARQLQDAEAAPRRLVPRGRGAAGLVALVGTICGPWKVLRYVGSEPVVGRDGLPRRPGSPLMLARCRRCGHRRLVQASHLRHKPPACHACQLAERRS